MASFESGSGDARKFYLSVLNVGPPLDGEGKRRRKSEATGLFGCWTVVVAAIFFDVITNNCSCDVQAVSGFQAR
jgi:hypothetical protein